jgi:hypothetical protein
MTFTASFESKNFSEILEGVERAGRFFRLGLGGVTGGGGTRRGVPAEATFLRAPSKSARSFAYRSL